MLQQYETVPGDIEFTSFQAMYNTVMGMDEPLTAYLIRCQELFAQIPMNNGFSNMSQATFHKIVVKGLLHRTEFAGFINSFHYSHFNDFLALSAALMHYTQVTDMTIASINGSSTTSGNLAAAAYDRES
eukprot:gene26338-17435_t